MSLSANQMSKSNVTYISIYYVKSAEGTGSSGQCIAAVSDLKGGGESDYINMSAPIL